MKVKAVLPLLLVFSLGLLFPGPATADGIIIPEPPICPPGPCPPRPLPMAQLHIRYHHVEVTVEDQVAVTHVDQVFYNPNDWQVEGTYVFPIPVDAVVTSFTLWIDGEPVEGQVLDASQARQKYEEIVRSLQDPALLEYVGRGAVQARIFPIPAKGERRIELEYSQVLLAEEGLVRYVYPLSTEKFSMLPLENVSVAVSLKSGVPIRAVYSPTHPVDTARLDDFQVRAGYEDSNVTPDTDFALYYSLGEEQAFHLMTYREAGEQDDPDGFFMLLLAPRPQAAAQVLAKDVILVLDRSGSMDGDKFIQAQDALRYVVRHLNPDDRFNIIAFSTGTQAYASNLRPAEEANEALAWVDQLSAQGSTDINRALLEAAALVKPGRPTYIIFLTDGLPTEGVVESARILSNFSAAAPDNLRLFTFGVGYDVDTFLLDSLAQENHGLGSYVLPGERLDEIISAFYTRISTPVLTDLSLEFEGISTYDIYPSPLPDLFAGSQIVVVGRYRLGEPGDAAAEVSVSGLVNGERQTFSYPGLVFTAGSPAQAQAAALTALPRLWATRKIGSLLNQVRLNGPDQETIDQIVRLSIRYGIVTPYTSYLVTEPMPLTEAGRQRIAGDQYSQMQAAPGAVSGQEAVEKAMAEGEMSDALSAAPPSAENASNVRIIGSRTYVLSDGVWTDTAFDTDRMQTTKVPFLSDDYFALSAARPTLAAAFALGERVIALSDGTAYEVIGAQETAPAVDIPDPAAPPDANPNVSQPENPASPAEILPVQEVPASDRSNSLPCLGGLLPVAVLGMAGVWLGRKR